MRSSGTIWTCLVRGYCKVSPQRSSAFTCARMFEIGKWRPNFPLLGHHRRWKLDLWLQSTDKSAVVAMEEPAFTKTEDSTAGQKCDINHVDRFLTLRPLCTGNLPPLVKQRMPSFTVTFWGGWERTCSRNDWNCGTTVTGSCIMTMHPFTPPWKCSSYWWLTAWQSSHTLHTHQI